MSDYVRINILDGVAARINRLYGPHGSTGQWLRKVWRRPWRPGNTMRPSATVVDYGVQAAERRDDTEATKSRTLEFQVVLDLAEDWDRGDALEDWSARVEAMAVAITNYNPGGCRRLEFVEDDPFEVLLQDGKSEQIWILTFEAEYWVEVGSFGKA